MESELLTLKQAAPLAGVSHETLRRRVLAGLIPAEKVRSSGRYGWRFMIAREVVEGAADDTSMA